MRVEHKLQYKHRNKICVLPPLLLLGQPPCLHPLLQYRVTFLQPFNRLVVVTTRNQRVEPELQPVPDMLDLACQQLFLLTLNYILFLTVILY